MSNTRSPISYKGKSIGIITLTIAQSSIGAIHVFSGLWLLTAGFLADFISAQFSPIYGVYTLIFGLLTWSLPVEFG